MGGDVYRLKYRWTIRGPIETVFHYVTDARTFLDWFPVFGSVRVDDPARPIQVGSHAVMRVKALLPYILDWETTVVKHEPPRFQEVAVKLSLSGRLRMNGRIRYRFEQRSGGVVDVYNDQELAAEKPLPRILHPIAQAAFTLNHDWAMGRAQAPLQAIVTSRPVV